jgi:hypothetical protein
MDVSNSTNLKKSLYILFFWYAAKYLNIYLFLRKIKKIYFLTDFFWKQNVICLGSSLHGWSSKNATSFKQQ